MTDFRNPFSSITYLSFTDTNIQTHYCMLLGTILLSNLCLSVPLSLSLYIYIYIYIYIYHILLLPNILCSYLFMYPTQNKSVTFFLSTCLSHLAFFLSLSLSLSLSHTHTHTHTLSCILSLSLSLMHSSFLSISLSLS